MKQILCYGDSNTWGLIPKTNDRYPWGVRWTSILSDRLAMDGAHVIEEGLCGRTTIFEDEYRANLNGLKSLPGLLDAHRHLDGVVLMLGTNDCKTFFNTDAEKIAEGIEKCLDVLLEKVPAEKILLLSPIHLGEEVWKEDFDPEFNQKSVGVSKELYQAYKALAERKHVNFMAASDYAVPSPIDQEHMTPEGHASLADAVFGALTESAILN